VARGVHDDERGQFFALAVAAV
jgi:hypothetical protein